MSNLKMSPLTITAMFNARLQYMVTWTWASFATPMSFGFHIFCLEKVSCHRITKIVLGSHLTSISSSTLKARPRNKARWSIKSFKELHYSERIKRELKFWRKEFPSLPFNFFEVQMRHVLVQFKSRHFKAIIPIKMGFWHNHAPDNSFSKYLTFSSASNHCWLIFWGYIEEDFGFACITYFRVG